MMLHVLCACHFHSMALMSVVIEFAVDNVVDLILVVPVCFVSL
jgi:hypothetical protein